MAERSSHFRDTLQELIEGSPEPMDHPSPDQWIAYHRGELSAEEEERLQEHLVRCRDCFDLAESSASFAEERPEADKEVASAALWRLLRPQLASSADNGRAISAGSRRRLSWRLRLPSSLAALFLVALVGLCVWSLQLQRALDARRAPQANAPIVDLAAGERVSGDRELAVSSGPLMLVLHPEEELPAYRLAIRDAATGHQAITAKLRLNRDFALTLYLSEGLRPGLYRLELSGGPAGKVLETHRLRVTAAGRGE